MPPKRRPVQPGSAPTKVQTEVTELNSDIRLGSGSRAGCGVWELMGRRRRAVGWLVIKYKDPTPPVVLGGQTAMLTSSYTVSPLRAEAETSTAERRIELTVRDPACETPQNSSPWLGTQGLFLHSCFP